MKCCYECGKAIKGRGVFTNPPLYLIRLKLDFPKAYHEKCYREIEKKAKIEFKEGRE